MSIYCFDIDGTICETEGTDYENATPIPWMVEAINKLAEAGHEIRYYTARGWTTDYDLLWAREQLREWGLPNSGEVHQKPAADIYVDDRAKLPLEFRMEFLADCLERGMSAFGGWDTGRGGDFTNADGSPTRLVANEVSRA